MKKKPANLSPAYRKFVHDRDLALEKIKNNFSFRISDALGATLARIYDMAHSYASRVSGSTHASANLEHEFDLKIRHIFATLEPMISHDISRMNRLTYLLAFAGESEAIGQATHKNIKVGSGSPKAYQMTDGAIHDRVDLALYKLRHKIMVAFKRARIQELPLNEFLSAIKDSFPRRERVPERKHILRDPKLREAAGEKKSRFSFDTISDDEWAQIVDEYLQNEVPTYPFRTPEMMPDKYYIPSQDREVYAWEIEQEATQSFVDQVRAGQDQAFKDAGITDFVWIAVVDDKTDDCCAKRDGLTGTEIEAKLAGPWADDDCDAASPPAHFNCRCTFAPLTDNVQEVTPPSAMEFDEWLKS